MNSIPGLKEDGRTTSSPADLGGNKEEYILDKEFEKIFSEDRFDPAKLNPAGTRNVDEGRKYYRSTSVSEELEPQETVGDDGKEAYGGAEADAPVQGHDNYEFPQSRHIVSKKKKKHQHGQHRRLSEQARSDLPAIPGEEQSEQEEEEAEEEGSCQPSGSSFPWKVSSTADPVLDSEHSSTIAFPKDAPSTPPVFSTEQEGEPEKKKGAGIKFTLGEEDEEEEDFEEDLPGHRQYRRPSAFRKSSKVEEHYKRSGAAVKNPIVISLTEEDARNLKDVDIEDIGSHRFEKSAGLLRHKIKKGSIALTDAELQLPETDKQLRALGYGFQKAADHTPHQLFVEMDELEGEEWVEKARWIKYEEDLEAEAGRWGQPHVSSLSFRSLLNVRRSLEKGVMLLDLQEVDLPGVVHRVVEQLSVEGIIEDEKKSELLRVLNYRHKYVQAHSNSGFRFGMRKSQSNKSLPDANSNMTEFKDKDQDALVLEMDGMGAFKRSSSGFIKRNDSTVEALTVRRQDILACLEEGTEGCLTLVGNMDHILRPVPAFVRLANSIVMNNTIEVNLPMRFIFILLVPKDNYNMDPHEIGRSFSTLMSNASFHNVCYKVEDKRELLQAINLFLDDSVVLPPGDWNKQKLLAMADIMDLRKRRQERKTAAEAITAAAGAGGDGPPPPKQPTAPAEDEPPRRNPLERTRIPFGGLIDDIKHRYPHYWADIRDGLNPQCFAATIFIYFAALSGAIAFGGLMGAKTNNDIGISETLIMSCISGIIFALFAGCPLIIIGTTGPVLLYDEALFSFCKSSEIEFLPWRTWIGIWNLVIALVIAGFQGSTLVKYFTKFTKDIFASLISLIFIYEALLKLYKVFQSHPLLPPVEYCNFYDALEDDNLTSRARREVGMFEELEDTELETTTAFYNLTLEAEVVKPPPNPNTALLSTILMLGTFFIAYFLRIFRNSKIFGRNVRRALGDFGVPIAIVIMVLVDYSAGDGFTEKLKVPNGVEVTNNATRGWFIPPTGNNEALPVWSMFAAFLPAILLYALLFMETHICELIMMEKTKGPGDKGAGIHLDIVILSVINFITGFMGGPWICAATVRAVSHVSALVVMSTNVIPGESPRIVGVRDQRLSALCVAILLGASVLLSPILKLVPFAVLFGVFLYMGVSGMNGIQFFDRLLLFVMPVKHHPQVSYVKHVKTWRMMLFTVFQGIGLIVLWIVKSTSAALAFPFFVMAMIPYRVLLKFIFTEKELEALDGPQAGKDLSGEKEEEEADFFEAAADCPIVPKSSVSFHRSILGMVNIPGINLPLDKINKLQ